MKKNETKQTYHYQHDMCSRQSSRGAIPYGVLVRTALAAVEKASNMKFDLWALRAGACSSSACVDSSETFPLVASVSNTRFVPGGDHFMTTAFTSTATAESSPATWEEVFADCIEPCMYICIYVHKYIYICKDIYIYIYTYKHIMYYMYVYLIKAL